MTMATTRLPYGLFVHLPTKATLKPNSFSGRCTNSGQGVPQNYAEAVKWYRLAADQGSAAAQTNLGDIYDLGHGVPQNYAEAVKWYRLAADQGSAAAQNNLGALYASGHGVPQNYTEAVKWYRLAADQGDDIAQYNLGVMYLTGSGVPVDYVLAYMWFALAAKAGDRAAVNSGDFAAQSMTRVQIAEAQKLAREWKPQLPQVARRDDVAPTSNAPSQNPPQ